MAIYAFALQGLFASAAPMPNMAQTHVICAAPISDISSDTAPLAPSHDGSDCQCPGLCAAMGMATIGDTSPATKLERRAQALAFQAPAAALPASTTTRDNHPIRAPPQPHFV